MMRANTYDTGEGGPSEAAARGTDRHVDWAEDVLVLNIHAGISGIHRGLGALGGGAFGPLERAQKVEVDRLEDTSGGILEELEDLIESAGVRGNGSDPRRAAPSARGATRSLGFARVLYAIDRDRKSGVLSVEDAGHRETFHLVGGEFGYPEHRAGSETSESEARRQAIARVDGLFGSPTARFEFTESPSGRGMRSLGLDTVRLILDGIRAHYAGSELEDACGDPSKWHLRPGAMSAITSLPLTAEEMSIARLLGAGWSPTELEAEAGLEGRVLPLAAVLRAFGLFGTPPDDAFEPGSEGGNPTSLH